MPVAFGRLSESVKLTWTFLLKNGLSPLILIGEIGKLAPVSDPLDSV